MRVATVVSALLALLPPSASALPGLLTQTPHSRPFTVRAAQIVYTGDGSGILAGASPAGTISALREPEVVRLDPKPGSGPRGGVAR